MIQGQIQTVLYVGDRISLNDSKYTTIINYYLYFFEPVTNSPKHRKTNSTEKHQKRG